MPIIKCDNRSDSDNRNKIVQSFNITALSRAKLPPRVTYNGCCGPIADWVYTFSYESKANRSDSGLFHTGHACGDDFLSLLNLPRPPAFSALSVSSSSNTTKSNAGSAQVTVNSSTQLSNLNHEIYNTINILTIAFGPPDDAMRSLLEALATRPETDLSAGLVKYLNGVVAKKTHGKTVSQVVNDLKISHPTFRQFNFPEINAVLLAQGKASNF